MSCDEIRQYLSEYTAINKETVAIYSNLMKPNGLSDCAFFLMYAIREENGKCTQRDLCEYCMLSKQTVSSALKGLERNGYITLIPSDTDKRSKYVTLTDAGVLFAHEHIDFVFELEELAFRKLSNAERVAMVETARKYQKLLLAETEHYLKQTSADHQINAVPRNNSVRDKARDLKGNTECMSVG